MINQVEDEYPELPKEMALWQKLRGELAVPAIAYIASILTHACAKAFEPESHVNQAEYVNMMALHILTILLIVYGSVMLRQAVLTYRDGKKLIDREK